MVSVKTRMALTFGSALLILGAASLLPGPVPAGSANIAKAAMPTSTPLPPCIEVIVTTATPTRIPYTGPYVELYHEVERALASVRIEPLPPVRNATNTSWTFRWKSVWSQPQLEGLPGSQYLLPGGKPYLHTTEIEIVPDPVPDATFYPSVYQGVLDDHVEVPDQALPKGVYKWRLHTIYHSMSYVSDSNWTPWQRFEVK